MINPPEPTTAAEMIAAATLLATGCTAHGHRDELLVYRDRHLVLKAWEAWPRAWQWIAAAETGVGTWAELCERLRKLAVPGVTEPPRTDVLPTGYDAVTLSQVLRAAVDFGEATRAGDHAKAATALEVIRGHEALVRAGGQFGASKPLTWRDVPPRPRYATPANVRIGDSVAPSRFEVPGTVERIAGGWMFVRMPDGALVQTDLAAWGDA